MPDWWLLMHALEHFYHSTAQGEPALLAKSAGISDEMLDDALRYASIPPGPGSSWGIVRGRQTPYIMVQVGQGSSGAVTHHYIMLSVDLLRELRGNIPALLSLLDETMPSFDKPPAKLPQLRLEIPPPPTIDQQVDDLLQLMTWTHNRINNIEKLLSAIVEGVPLLVRGAPQDLETRTAFAHGLMTLLPSSTRYSVTFATHLTASARIPVQIRFMEEPPTAEAVIYHWDSGAVGGADIKNDYSRFITSQLRLDAELAITQSETLTPIAGWRFRRGDRLSEALDYASRRRRVDDALINNQPVAIEEVSRILAEDPTLSDEMRAVYARHVVNFALAMEDVAPAEPVGPLLRQNEALSAAILARLVDALNEGLSDLVFEMVVHWMSNPLGPSGEQWVDLTHSAALMYLDVLVAEQDTEFIYQFLDDVLAADYGVVIGRIVPRIIERLLPLMPADPELRQRLVKTAVKYLPPDQLRRLLALGQFRPHLPAPVLEFLDAMENPGRLPSGMLVAAADAFGDDLRDDIVLRFTELARSINRPELLDTETLDVLAAVSQRPISPELHGLLSWAVQTLHDYHLRALSEPGPRFLLQILLALGQYERLARSMITQSRDLYPGDKQFDYIRMVHLLFSSSSIPPEQAENLLNALQENGIRGIPFLVASVGVLEGANWGPSLMETATSCLSALQENPNYLELIHPSVVLALLRYFSRQQDPSQAVATAALIPAMAARRPSAGLKIMAQMYKTMQRDESLRSIALEVLRQYVREADDEAARKGLQFFSRDLGAEVGRRMEISYIVSRFMGAADILTFSERVHSTANLLQDMAERYIEKQPLPTADYLRETLDGLRTGLPPEIRRELGGRLLAMGEALVLLGGPFRGGGRYIDALLGGRQQPASALDVYYVMAGYFSRGARVPLNLQAVTSGSPFRRRTGDDLLDEVGQARALLHSAINGGAPKRLLKLKPQDVYEELTSLWAAVPSKNQQILREGLAADLQRLPELLHLIASTGDHKALQEDSALARKIQQGRYTPASVLELLRFARGYYSG